MDQSGRRSGDASIGDAKACAWSTVSFLFESVESGATRGRYSFIGMKPDLIWRCYGERAEINLKARTDQNAWEPCAEGALESLRRLVREMRVALPASLPPMATGLFGYIGYDMVRLMENLPAPNPDRWDCQTVFSCVPRSW